jgi:hypothetical protein
MITTSPLFGLRLDIEHCMYIVYVNGGTVTVNLEGTAGHEDQPINQWLRSGSNELEVHMYRAADEANTCDARVALMVKDVENERGAGAKALVLAHTAQGETAGDPAAGSSPAGTFDSHRGYRSADQGDLKVGPAKMTHIEDGAQRIDVLSRTFDVHLPFPEWAFFKGDKVRRSWEFKDKQDMTPTYNEIFAAHRKLWELLAKRDVNAFLDACDERSHEIDLAYFKKPGETRGHLRKELETAMNDPKLELAKIDKNPGKFWKYAVGSKGNLIALGQGAQLSTLFRYQMKDDTPFSVIFPVVFRKEGSRYIVTR